MKGQKERSLVFYDGTCPFCTFSATRLRKLDWFHQLEIIDMYSQGVLKEYQIPLEDATRRIQVINLKGKRKEGMDGLLAISLRLPALWLLVPFFRILILIGLGDRIYDWIAKNRFLFPVPGYCPLPENKSTEKN